MGEGKHPTPISQPPRLTKGKTKQMDRAEKHIVQAAAQAQATWKRTGQHCPHNGGAPVCGGTPRYNIGLQVRLHLL